MPPTVLHVALDLPRPDTYDYLPRSQADLREAVGVRVRVPFGRRTMIGVVTGVGPSSTDPARLKRIEARLDAQPLVDAELMDSLQRASRYYLAPPGMLLAAALPVTLRRGDPLPPTQALAWRLSEAGATARSGLRAGGRPRQLADLLALGEVTESVLDAALGDWRAAARSLRARGLAEAVPMAVPAPVAAVMAPPLRPDQSKATQAILAAAGRFQPILLEGVTGSGKTEVYLAAIADCLRRGLQALVLVPEIGLTPQALQRFRERLGVVVEAAHSGLADGERARAWLRMQRGEGKVLVGTRSAVFTPLPAAGLIVVDEEHDASYKQQDGVRYSARDVAVLRAQALGVPVLLGSATPSLESLAAVADGRYLHLRLPRRIGSAGAPRVEVIDLRRQVLHGGLSNALLAGIEQCLDCGEQALLFRNRRGYAPVLLCHDCGWSARCTRCDAALTVHRAGARLICHHCGGRQGAPAACPDCASLALMPQGAGTERIEEALAARFPGVPILRVDRETTRQRDGLARHLDRLGNGPGILVGTQMLAKGHDLPLLSLVGVVGVDEGLFSADFRAGERLAQLLIQVSGRAGRAERPGSVLLQTHQPGHPLLTTLLGGGYPAFAAIELAQRREVGFPPSTHMALLRAEATDGDAVAAFLHRAREIARERLPEDRTDSDAVMIHGPLPAPMARRQGRIRGQLLFNATRRAALHALLRPWMRALYELPEARRVRWSLDVDPLDLY